MSFSKAQHPCFHNQNLHPLLLSFSSSLTSTSSPHPHSFPPLLKFAAALRLLPLGLPLHLLTITLGLSADPHIASSLINFHSKTQNLPDARRVFDRMPVKTTVPWSAIVAAYSQSGDPNTAFSMYKQMLNDGTRPNSVTLLGLLSGLSQLDQLECIHASAIRYGFDMDIVLANSMLNVYGKCERLDIARSLFDSMPLKDIVSWNSMMVGYSRIGGMTQSMDLFRKLRVIGEYPDEKTYGSLLASISSHGGASIHYGNLVHALVITSGFQFDTQIETSLISFYLKFGGWEYAFRLFDRAAGKDVVSWTAMISGLVQNNSAVEALSVFRQMLRSEMMPTTTTIASVLSACAQLGLSSIGTSIHGIITRQRFPVDTAAKNSLITMYAKCGQVKQCRLIFDAMEDRDLVSWNAVVSGYAQNGYLVEAFVLFNKMRLALPRSDAITIVSLLQACATLGALAHGRSVHNFVIRHELNHCISVDTSLIDMYSKCGDLKTARRCFDLMPEQDLVSWSTIIAGYGSHGMGETALAMYSRFLQTGMKSNEVVFLSVLSACCHAGLVSQGLMIFKSMKEEFGVISKLEHGACIVNLLTKAGRIEEAVRFIATMSPKPNADILGILLDACRVNGYDHLVEMVAREIVALGPENAGSYIQLAHGYAAMNQWDGVGEAWARMRSLGLRKAPGWSFVELNGNITTFFVDHNSHPEYKEMIFLLKTLGTEMRQIDEEILA